MEFNEIALALGIETYPEELEAVYQKLPEYKVNIFDEELITQLQEQYEAFGDYYDAVIAAARDMRNDPIRTAWTETVATYIQNVGMPEIRKVPYPESNHTPAGDMLPMLALIPMIPKSIEDYRRRGFSEETVASCVKPYGRCIKATFDRTGMVGLNQLYFNWLAIYAKTLIFNIAGFNFELKKFPDYVICLKNKESGEMILLPIHSTVHKSGLILGTAGYEDAEGSFEAVLRETDDGYYGCPVENCRITNTITYYPKDQWECVLRPGDDVVSLHIPKGADLTPENVMASMKTGLTMAKQGFPDYSVKALMCVSWLLEPQIGDLMGSSSKIAGFGNMFHRFPIISNGKAIFNFVFIGQFPDYESLPEDTRMQRVFKKLYMDGGHIHHFGGIIL